MRIYVFKSETTDGLRAFAGDPDVNKLPHKHSPWTVTGTISPDNAPPTTSRATRSRKQSIRKAFNFGACAPKREPRTDGTFRPKGLIAAHHSGCVFPSWLRRNAARDREWAASGRSAG